jgi:hypothetical protein
MMRASAFALALLLALIPWACGADDPQPAGQLLEFKRVYVEKFTGEGAAQIRDMVIAAVQKAGLFILTENPERADAILRGSAEDLVFTDTFQSGEGVNARVAVGRTGRSTSGYGPSAQVGAQENTRIQERKHEASASVRLVNRDGDIVWSTTQESQGAKFKSAAADVADKVMRQLVQDYQKAKARRAGVNAPPSPVP